MNKSLTNTGSNTVFTKQARARSRWLALSLSLLLVSCAPTITLYDQVAYESVTSLKAAALRLMDKATEPYPTHATEVDALMLKVDQAYEYAKGLPKNTESTKQWELLKNPDGNLLGGFMKRWESSGTLSRIFIDNVKNDLVGPTFDEIIRLEIGKLRGGS